MSQKNRTAKIYIT